ncbi:hypothetical protein KFK09_004877 [Dendrobium nobile]|uniref:Protein kinase domain-containing protein n=1 Tax=Dendrobium nobile TaxID=94219 RepID=A0A8T3BXK7_DENNO|nr:hypothetical protein KFK09_004877 [Dendrobium nobile]
MYSFTGLLPWVNLFHLSNRQGKYDEGKYFYLSSRFMDSQFTIGLSIPAKSAPPSGFSSPVHNPWRMSNVDVFPSVFSASQGLKECPHKLHGSHDISPSYSPAIRSPILKLKNPKVNIIPDDPKSRNRATNSKLKHPNIVQYYGSEFTEDRFFIYRSINDYVQEHYGAMTKSVVRNFTHHILKGLAYLHSTNNIHRRQVNKFNISGKPKERKYQSEPNTNMIMG